MTIELAGVTDVNAIKGLYETLFEDMSKLQPDFFRAAGQDGDFIKSVIESGSDDIFLAKENQQVLGFALVQQKSTPPFPCFVPLQYAYLLDLVVASDQRGRGIGRQLIQAVKDWAAARKLEYIELGVLTQNEGAVRLYESMAFTEDRKVMRMRL